LKHTNHFDILYLMCEQKMKEERQMLKMSQINDIRDLASCGYRNSEIEKITGHDHKTIRNYLEREDFSFGPPEPAAKPSILDSLKETIDSWLEEDKKHWRKQRHTAKRVYDRLVDEKGFSGSYDTVQRYVKKKREKAKQSFLELIWEPGCAQVDFGEADFYERKQCIRKKYLIASFPFSNDSYVQIFGGETAECVCQGLQDMFQYIGGVPPLLVFDNATGVGRRVHDRITMTDLFSRFRAHYGFRIRFCNPNAGHEKGNVENKVNYSRHNLFVPIPSYDDIIVYNRGLLDQHLRKASEMHYRKKEEIASLFGNDRQKLLPLPRRPFNVCRYDTCEADGYGKICLDGKHTYSTCPENGGKTVRIGIRAHYIDVLTDGGSLLVRHERQFGETETEICDYGTTLALLCHKSGAWGNSGVRRETPDLLREYMDSQPRPALRNSIGIMKELTDQYGFRPALSAMEMTLRNGKLNVCDASVIAARITGYGIDTPAEAGPPLSVYDEAFLHRPEAGKEAEVC
jgi:transposase